MPRGGRHGNLSMKASRIYEALRRKGYSKTKSAKIANSRASAKGKAKSKVKSRTGIRRRRR